MNLSSLFRRRNRRAPAAPADGRAVAGTTAAASDPAIAPDALLVVPTESADGRRAVDALAAGAAREGRAVAITPRHRLEAAAAGSTGPIVLLTASPVRALLDAMRRGVPPSAALAGHRAARAEAEAAARSHGRRATLLDIATVEADEGGEAVEAGGANGFATQAPDEADPVVALVAAAAAGGAGDEAAWDAAFHRHRALAEEVASLSREAAAWTGRQLAGGDETARQQAAAAVLEAEAERLRLEVARLRDALARRMLGEARPRRHEIDIAAAAVLHGAFYDAERAGDRPFRWLGREAEARIATLLPRRAAARVDVTVEIAVSRAALEDLRIGLDDMAPATVTIAPLDRGRSLVSATFPGDPSGPALARRELVLHAGTRVDMRARGDPRTLAVAVGGIVVEEIDEEAVGGTPSTADAAAGHGSAGHGAAVREILLERLAHPAFHGPERRADGLAFRWLGRAETADIPVRLPRGVPVRIGVRLAGAAGPEALAGFTLAVDGVAAVAAETTMDETTVDETGAAQTGGAEMRGAETAALFRLAGLPAAGERAARLTLAAPTRDRPARGEGRRLSVAVHAIRIETAHGAPAERITAVPSPLPFAVAVEAASLPATAFWDLETARGRPFRWMGRSEAATIPLVVPPGRPLAVTVEMVAAVSAEALAGFEISLGGRAADIVLLERPADGRILKTALFPALPAGGPVALGLLARHTATPGGADPRTIAVALSRLTVDAL